MNVALLFALQAASPWVISPATPTVGDTVVVERTVVLDAEARLRAQPLTSSLLIEPLADPVVVRNGRGVLVRYTLALFEPGRHVVAMPTSEVLYRDGRVDQVNADSAWIAVVPVLGGADSLAPPKPSLPPIARFPTRWLPLALLVGVVAATATAWAWRRRQRRAVPAAGRSGALAGAAPIARWVTAGEGRAVAAVAADRLRTRIAQLEPRAGRSLAPEECIATLEAARPDWPVRDLADVLRELERAQFSPAVASDVERVVARVDAIRSALA